MIVQSYFRTIDLARAGQISVQQVRNYEASDFIPPAQRGPTGYRLYTQKHLVAIKTARHLVGGYGWQRARAIMQAVHRGELLVALALIDERHAELAGKRLQFEQTLAALSTLAGQPSSLPATRNVQPLRVGEAARQVGVQVSAVRFWEQQGLLHPVRDNSSHYRLYDEQQMRRLRVVALLRDGGYNFSAIHVALDELAALQPERAIAAVEKRRAELARTSWDCLAAISSFQSYISEFWADLVSSL
jgi:DNA-binding transcriptional MerR regulator